MLRTQTKGVTNPKIVFEANKTNEIPIQLLNILVLTKVNFSHSKAFQNKNLAKYLANYLWNQITTPTYHKYHNTIIEKDKMIQINQNSKITMKIITNTPIEYHVGDNQF